VEKSLFIAIQIALAEETDKVWGEQVVTFRVIIYQELTGGYSKPAGGFQGF